MTKLILNSNENKVDSNKLRYEFKSLSDLIIHL